MIKGMTGYGTAPFAHNDIKGLIEIKSQNHRYLDLVFYLPVGFAAIENKIRQLISKNIQRGRVTISVKITQKPAPAITFYKQVVDEYFRTARKWKNAYKLSGDFTIADVIRLPGVVESRDTLIRPETVWPTIERSLKTSLKSLSAMRTREGRALTKDIGDVLKRMKIRLKIIQARSKLILKQKKKSLTTEEFGSFQKGIDINEEITRLSHYIDEFKLLLKSSSPVGKKLDFVAQEMQRETNTIGSKLQDKVVANAVVAIKSKIEKLREQAQNIE